MKPRSTITTAPRRLLLHEAAATASRTPATNNTTSKATAIVPSPPPPPTPHAANHQKSPPYGVPPHEPRSGSGTDTVRFDSSSVAVTALVILSALFFLGFFSVYARRFFAPDWDNPDRSSTRRRRVPVTGRAYPHAAPRGLTPDAIKALPLVRYSASKAAARGGDEEDHRCCAVCLGEFEDNEELRSIPRCGHAFHRECIDAWLSAHGSCPLCRSTDLFGAGGPQRKCDACQLECVVVAPTAAPELAAGEGEGGGAGHRHFEGDNGQSAEAPVVSPEAQGLGGMGRSRSCLCIPAVASDEKGPGPPAATAASASQSADGKEQPPRPSCG